MKCSYSLNDKGCSLGDSYPIDELGMCIFHSHNSDWKKKNDFGKSLDDFIASIFNKESFLDLSGFVFVSNEKSRFILKDIQFPQNSINLKGARFLDPAWFKNITLNNFDLSESRFEDKAIFEDCDLFSFNISASELREKLIMRRCSVESYSFFNKVDFQGLATIEDVVFNGVADFEKAVFSFNNSNEYEEPTVYIRKTKFHGELSFINVVFDCCLWISDGNFDSTVKFINTKFNANCEIGFEEMLIRGAMLFESTDPNNKMFNNSVYFHISPASIEGEIRFENVNYFYINSKHREVFKSLIPLRKVTVGPGCEKYLTTTSIREMLVSEDLQNLALELAETFKSFFILEESINLGIEVVYRDKTVIRYYYFTDQYIETSEFYRKLGLIEEKMWGLIYNHNLVKMLGTARSETSKADMLSAYINLISIFFKLGIRNSVTIHDIDSLKCSLGFSPSLPASPIIVQKITQNFTAYQLTQINSAPVHEQNIIQKDNIVVNGNIAGQDVVIFKNNSLDDDEL